MFVTHAHVLLLLPIAALFVKNSDSAPYFIDRDATRDGIEMAMRHELEVVESTATVEPVKTTDAASAESEELESAAQTTDAAVQYAAASEESGHTPVKPRTTQASSAESEEEVEPTDTRPEAPQVEPQTTDAVSAESSANEEKTDYHAYALKEGRQMHKNEENYFEHSKESEKEDLRQESWLHDRMKSFRQPTAAPTNESIPVKPPPLDYTDDEDKEYTLQKLEQDSFQVVEKSGQDETLVAATAAAFPQTNVQTRGTLKPFKEIINREPPSTAEETTTLSTAPTEESSAIPVTPVPATTAPTTAVSKSPQPADDVAITESRHLPNIPVAPALSQMLAPSTKMPALDAATAEPQTSTTTTQATTTHPKHPQIFDDAFKIGTKTSMEIEDFDKSFWEKVMDGVKCSLRDCDGVLLPTQPSERERLRELSISRFARGHESALPTPCPCTNFKHKDSKRSEQHKQEDGSAVIKRY